MRGENEKEEKGNKRGVDPYTYITASWKINNENNLKNAQCKSI